MAKQSKRSNSKAVKADMDQIVDGSYVYTASSSGVEVRFISVSLIALERAEAGIEQDMRDEGKRLDPPTYEVEVLGGDTLTYELNTDLLEVKDDPAETERRQREWAEYQAAIAELRQRQDDVRNEMIFDSILLQLPEDDSWEAKQRRYHIRVPEDLEAKRRHWIETEILRSIDDMVGLITYILAKSASGEVEMADVDAARRSFRDLISTSLKEAGQASRQATARPDRTEGEAEVGA